MSRTSHTLAAVSAAGLLAFTAHASRAETKVNDVVDTYMSLGSAIFGDALQSAKALQSAVDAFLAAPNDKTLAAARTAWKASRVPYMQTEAFRFGNAIVDDWEGRVNAWPLDEGLIDYVDKGSYGETSEENPLYTANVIANPVIKVEGETIDAKTIDKDLLRKLQEAMDVEANVATGYHAVEFMLWGQDLNGTNPGSGDRPATDFDLKACTHDHCDRRRDYLKAATSLLVDDLQEMSDNWKDGGAARKAILAESPEQQLSTILTGIGSLSYGELAGERMKLGVILHDTEEEHDCFSDNTQNSHYGDQLGMMAVWNGTYDGPTAVKGASIAALARERAPEAAKRLDDAMATTHAKLKALKDKADSGEMAYDQMLAAGNETGNKLVLDGVDALVAQARAVEAVVAALKLTVKIEGSDSLDNPAAVGKP